MAKEAYLCGKRLLMVHVLLSSVQRRRHHTWHSNPRYQAVHPWGMCKCVSVTRDQLIWQRGPIIRQKRPIIRQKRPANTSIPEVCVSAWVSQETYLCSKKRPSWGRSGTLSRHHSPEVCDICQVAKETYLCSKKGPSWGRSGTLSRHLSPEVCDICQWQKRPTYVVKKGLVGDVVAPYPDTSALRYV